MKPVLIVVVAAASILIAAPAVAQLMNSDADRLWTDKPLDPQTQRRNVTYCIDPPPVGAPAGLAQAVEDAIAAWAKSFPGGIQFVSTANCAAADVRVSWGQNQASWGTTSARAGGTGQRVVTLETKNNGGWLTPQQVENIARHEFGHVKGLRDNAKSGVMKPSTLKANLAGGDWPVGAVDMGANRSVYFDFYDVVRPPIYASLGFASPVGGGYNYAYNLNLANTALAPVNAFNVATLSAMEVRALPPGWNAHFVDSAEDKGPGHFAPATMVCTAAPGFELMPGQNVSFQFFSPGAPQNGWVYAEDATGEVAEIGDTPSMVTPGATSTPAPAAGPAWLTAIAALMLLAGAGTLMRRSWSGGAARA